MYDVDWQPIETAPKKGDFLVYLRNGYISRGRYESPTWLGVDSCGPQGMFVMRGFNDVTYWAPLPNPPKV